MTACSPCNLTLPSGAPDRLLLTALYGRIDSETAGNHSRRHLLMHVSCAFILAGLLGIVAPQTRVSYYCTDHR